MKRSSTPFIYVVAAALITLLIGAFALSVPRSDQDLASELSSITSDAEGEQEATYMLVIEGETRQLGDDSTTPYSTRVTPPTLTLAGVLFREGYALTGEAIGDRNGVVHRTDAAYVLRLYVNGEEITESINLHKPRTGDNILLYHGPNDQSLIENYLNLFPS